MNRYCELKETFYLYARGRIRGQQFMRYVHNNNWISNIISYQNFKTLLAFDLKEYIYRTKIKTLFFSYFNKNEYEHDFIIHTLEAILLDLNDINTIRYALTLINNMYQDGCKELEQYALKYQPPTCYQAIDEKDDELIYCYLPSLVIDTKSLIHDLKRQDI